MSVDDKHADGSIVLEHRYVVVGRSLEGVVRVRQRLIAVDRDDGGGHDGGDGLGAHTVSLIGIGSEHANVRRKPPDG